MKSRLLHKKAYNKFKNHRVKNILGNFDSKLEYKHFLLLKAKEQKGDISQLKKQVRIKLGNAKECKVYYVADFVYKLERFYPYDEKNPELIKKSEKN